MKVWFGRTEAVILTESVEDDISYRNLGKISSELDLDVWVRITNPKLNVLMN